MSSFIDAVAERAQLKPELARQILEARGIVLQPQAAAPAALQLERLAFNGTKRLAGQDPEPIAVHHEFEAGLTAVTSTKNLMGKSSVLWLIRWGLTGRRPSDLADDVRRWLDDASLEGTVGTEHFSVHWRIRDGASAEGSLTVGDTTATFDTPEGFEETMGAFMLDRLRLSATPWWKKQREGHDDEGTVSLHGWPAYFAALLIRGDKVDVLLGERNEGALAQTLLQVFLGLPWALTKQSADTALKDLQHQAEASKRRTHESAKAREEVLQPARKRLAEIAERLETLEALPGAVEPAETDRRVRTFATASADVAGLSERLATARQQRDVARSDADELAKRLSALREDAVIVPLLGRVSPVSCPRCTTTIADQRRAEQERGQCMVCDEPLSDEESLVPQIDETAALMLAAGQALDQAEAVYADAEAELSRAQATVEASRRSVKAITQATASIAEIRRLEIEQAKIEGRIEQAEIPHDDPEATAAKQAHAVVSAASKEAERRRAAASKNLLEELGHEVVELSRRFGFEQLEVAEPKLNATLPLRAAGEKSWFGRRNPGERLRLKLALVIALLRVGDRLGIGRHPGLLLIDSPGGEEMVEADVGTVLEEIDMLCRELPQLQVVCATARTDAVQSLLSEERIMHGPDWTTVW